MNSNFEVLCKNKKIFFQCQTNRIDCIDIFYFYSMGTPLYIVLIFLSRVSFSHIFSCSTCIVRTQTTLRRLTLQLYTLSFNTLHYVLCLLTLSRNLLFYLSDFILVTVTDVSVYKSFVFIIKLLNSL